MERTCDDARADMIQRRLDADGDEEREGGSSHGNTHLPYGLCKELGIGLPDKATPHDAWEALKGKGVDHDAAIAALKENGSLKSYIEKVKKGQTSSAGSNGGSSVSGNKVANLRKTFTGAIENVGELAQKKYDEKIGINEVVNKQMDVVQKVLDNMDNPDPKLRDELLPVHLWDVRDKLNELKRPEKTSEGWEFDAYKKTTTAKINQCLKIVNDVDNYVKAKELVKKAEDEYKVLTDKDSDFHYNMVGYSIRDAKRQIADAKEKHKYTNNILVANKFYDSELRPVYDELEKKINDLESEAKAKESEQQHKALDFMSSTQRIANASWGDKAKHEKYTQIAASLKRLDTDTHSGKPYPMLKGSDGKQYYTNGCVCYRFNDDVMEHTSDLHDDMVKYLQAEFNLDKKGEVNVDVTADNIKAFLSKHVDNKAVMKLNCGDDEILVNPRYLQETMKVIDNPKFYGIPCGDVGGASKYTGLYVKGDNADGFIMPVINNSKITVYDQDEVKNSKTVKSSDTKQVAYSKETQKQFDAIKNLNKMNGDRPAFKNVFQDGNRQVYSNGCMGIRYDNPVVKNAVENDEYAVFINNAIDKAKGECNSELTPPFTQQELADFVAKMDANKVASNHEYVVMLSDYDKDNPDNNYAVDAKLLYDTMSQLTNPKIYVKRGAKWANTSSIYIEGDDGEAAVCPFKVKDYHYVKDVKTGKSVE